MWIQHPDFLRLVEENWNSGIVGNPQYVLSQNLKMMKLTLKAWNRNFFGDLRLKVFQAETKVQPVQELLDASPSEILHQGLAEAKASLHNWLQIKETY